MKAGAFYVALGDPARYEARLSIETLMRQMPHLPVQIYADEPMADLRWYPAGQGKDRWGRQLKLSVLDLAPPEWQHILYIDADTRVYQNLEPGFAMLADGWDIVLAHSEHQDKECLYHVGDEEREITLDEAGYTPLQLQAGVMFIRRSDATHQFFKLWQEEWARYGGQDQGAMLRALQRYPLRIHLLGRPWNGGAVIGHFFGNARRKA